MSVSIEYYRHWGAAFLQIQADFEDVLAATIAAEHGQGYVTANDISVEEKGGYIHQGVTFIRVEVHALRPSLCRRVPSAYVSTAFTSVYEPALWNMAVQCHK